MVNIGCQKIELEDEIYVHKEESKSWQWPRYWVYKPLEAEECRLVVPIRGTVNEPFDRLRIKLFCDKNESASCVFNAIVFISFS